MDQTQKQYYFGYSGIDHTACRGKDSAGNDDLSVRYRLSGAGRCNRRRKAGKERGTDGGNTGKAGDKRVGDSGYCRNHFLLSAAGNQYGNGSFVRTDRNFADDHFCFHGRDVCLCVRIPEISGISGDSGVFQLFLWTGMPVFYLSDKGTGTGCIRER